MQQKKRRKVYRYDVDETALQLNQNLNNPFIHYCAPLLCLQKQSEFCELYRIDYITILQFLC